MRYSYSDYEEAYYRCHINDCKEIGLSLLSDKKLINDLESIHYQWNLPQEELERITDILLKVKIELMLNKC